MRKYKRYNTNLSSMGWFEVARGSKSKSSEALVALSHGFVTRVFVFCMFCISDPDPAGSEYTVIGPCRI